MVINAIRARWHRKYSSEESGDKGFSRGKGLKTQEQKYPKAKKITGDIAEARVVSFPRLVFKKLVCFALSFSSEANLSKESLKRTAPPGSTSV